MIQVKKKLTSSDQESDEKALVRKDQKYARSKKITYGFLCLNFMNFHVEVGS